MKFHRGIYIRAGDIPTVIHVALYIYNYWQELCEPILDIHYYSNGVKCTKRWGGGGGEGKLGNNEKERRKR